jgi:hypothetical protein
MGNKWKGISDLSIGDKLNDTDTRDIYDHHVVIEEDSDSWQAQRMLEEQRHIEQMKSFSEIKGEVSQIISGLEELVSLLEDIRRILQEETSDFTGYEIAKHFTTILETAAADTIAASKNE